MKTQPATGETYPKSDLFNKAVAYQYGTNLASATPNFWSQVTNGQWQEAINNLNNFGDAYPTRRRSEAALIQSDLDAGKLP
ncbi:pesticin C-terminus-like muramidase [Klebsiella pneumoniae]|uniref:pesticin C-terminus-like muramidase n=1 Tax=Klebsiella pneumoniae TaxID=573 RepID=UPI000E349A98